MIQDNKLIIRRVFEEVWNKNDFSLIDQVYSPEYVAHIAGSPRDIEGPEQFKQFVALHGVMTSELHFGVDEQVAEDDRVATRWTATSTTASGLIAGGGDSQTVTVTGISIHHIADGKIVESWDNWDALTLYQSLGSDVFERVSLSI